MINMKDKINILLLAFCFFITGCVSEDNHQYKLEEVANELYAHTFTYANLIDIDYEAEKNAMIYLKDQTIDTDLEYFNGDSTKQQRILFYEIGEQSRGCILISELDNESRQLVSVYLTMLWPTEEVKSYEHIRSSQYQMNNILFSIIAEGEDWYDIAYFLEEFADYIRDYN